VALSATLPTALCLWCSEEVDYATWPRTKPSPHDLEPARGASPSGGTVLLRPQRLARHARPAVDVDVLSGLTRNGTRKDDDVDQTTDALRQLVAVSSRVMAANGSSDLIWGHVSARDPHGRGVWLKQGSYGLDEIRPDRVHLVGWEGEVVEGGGQRHAEWPIHTEVMAARPDVGGVVHVHSRYAVALAASGVPLLPVSHEANYFAPTGVPRFDETADLIVTTRLGRAVATTLGSSVAAFLVNHGVVTTGRDLRAATVAAIILDRACSQQLLTAGFGGEPVWSDPEESLRKREHIYTEAAINQVWDYLERRLDA
jgi:L-fuculose-phosphate aldolase